jgi:hypothetical protein
MNKINSTFAFAFALLSLSLGTAIADDTKASKPAIEAESKQQVEPHSHPKDAKGVNVQPQEDKSQRKSKRPDEKTHFHPRDGK